MVTRKIFAEKASNSNDILQYSHQLVPVLPQHSDVSGFHRNVLNDLAVVCSIRLGFSKTRFLFSVILIRLRDIEMSLIGVLELDSSAPDSVFAFENC